MPESNTMSRRDPQVRRAPNSAGLYDVLDLILDKGIVIDAFVRVSLVGIELLTVDARVVIASVDTYLRYAEGAERLQLYARSQAKRLPDMVEGEDGGIASGGKKLLKKGAMAADRLIEHGGDEHGRSQDQAEDGQEQEEGIGHTIAKGMRKAVGKVFHSVGGSDESDEGEQEKGAPEQRPRQANGSGGSKHARAGARR
jgi:gas vesicle structural protein